ncbi:MAG TPA: 30S ribosomal protein S20 [Syntrophorhabdaceae bacterium]|nr:30S ribosomal protein S20 [Syntrophorhabdaceae bacterium]HPU29832.1 30S ribosomal protein S20 [Syntrophorhabdaceae bacterium]
MKKNKSAIKRAKQAEKRRLRNSHIKSTMKTYIKKALSAIENKEIENIDANLRAAISYINKTASKGVIHKNTASRRISRLTKRANEVLIAKTT